MLSPELKIDDDFPSVTYDQWRELAERDLNGAPFDKRLVRRTYEGIEVQPIYTAQDWASGQDPLGFPGLPNFARGSRTLGAAKSGWDLRQEHSHPDLASARQAILDDLDGGVTSIVLKFDGAARAGLDPDHPAARDITGPRGLMVYSVSDLEALLSDVHLNMVGIVLDAGGAVVPAAALLAGLWQRRGISADVARGALNADPLGTLARDGVLPTSLEQALSTMAELAKWTEANYPHVTAVGVDTSVYHDAGASATQDLGFALATGVEYLRAMADAGIDVDAAARQMVFSISLGTHHFRAIAKLRAARQVWNRVVEACGGSPAARAMRLHARTARRVLTSRDPYVNLLRNTVAVFAAGVGGAESITSAPLDAAIGQPDASSRRIARNTLHVLQDETHLNRVIDPAGGSWYLDWLTDQMATKAWEFFQHIEQQGGMRKSLESGWVADQLDAAFAPRAKAIATRKDGITGVSEFPDVSESPVVREVPDLEKLRDEATQRIAKARQATPELEAIASSDHKMANIAKAAADGASIGQLADALGFRKDQASIPQIVSRPLAEPFELLRDASDAWMAAKGSRPKVFLANLGPVAHHTARATFSKNFFAAGGFETDSNNGFADAESAASAFKESGANIAVICSSDKLYPDLVPEAAAKLKAAGARTVVLAGNPADNEANWREAGVDRFIYIKCDVLATLRELLQEEGVLVG